MAAINKINLDDTTYDLNDARLADFIVEQGTNSGWTYRKYNSGVMEAWSKIVGTSTGATSSVNLTKTFPDGMKAATAVNANVGSTGSVGAECHFLQNLLKGLGYYSGSLDLTFGDGCKKATIAFQKANGMAGDGDVGKNTWRKLIGF